MWMRIKPLLKRRIAALCVLGLFVAMLPRPAKAQFGIDLAVIVAGLNQINSLLSSAVGAPLQNIQQIESQNTQYQQNVVYPVAAINQLKSAALGFQNQMARMNNIMQAQYASSQLPAPQQLEQLLVSTDPNSINQVGSAYQQVYGTLPANTQAPPEIRNNIDISDAQAQDAMKKAIQLEALANRELEVSQQLQQQIQSASPGTAPMVEGVAAAWVVRANAYSQSAMAELMRVRSATVANHSAWLKQSTASANALSNQMQSVVTR
jgi:hypothetical protein